MGVELCLNWKHRSVCWWVKTYQKGHKKEYGRILKQILKDWASKKSSHRPRYSLSCKCRSFFPNGRACCSRLNGICWAGCMVPMVPSHTSRCGWTPDLQNRLSGGFNQPWQSSVSHCVQLPPSKWLKFNWRCRREQPGSSVGQFSRGCPGRLCRYLLQVPWAVSSDPFDHDARVIFRGGSA